MSLLPSPMSHHDVEHELSTPLAEEKQVQTGPVHHDRSGRIFGYLALPHLFLGSTDALWDIFTFLLGYDLDYNNLEYVTGLAQAPQVDRSPASMNSLNFHAIVGSVGILLMGFLVVSGTIFPNKKPKILPKPLVLRKWHRMLGPMAAVFWIAANLSGVYYLFASQRIADKQAHFQDMEKFIHKFFHCLVGTASLTNVAVGIIALFQRDLVLHHGAMYFTFYWGNFVNLFKFVRSLVQCVSGGGMNIRTYTLIAAVVLTVETPLYAAIGYRYGGQAYRRPIVAYNLLCFAFLITSGWVALLVQPPSI